MYPRPVPFRRQSRTALVTAGALTALTLFLGGCAAASGIVPDDGDSASASQQAAFPELYGQTIDWHRCGGDAETAAQLEAALRDAGGRIDGMRCAQVTAPLDWTDTSTGATIKLGIVHIPATGDAAPIGTLLSNPGGPGASGIEYTIGMAVSPSFATVHERYDLLGFDPRGMSASTPIECDAESSILELNLARCAEADPLAASMGSAQVARDMDLLRHLVGDSQLHYTGFSYGTVIGASYVTLFPERVGRVMLDSAWPSNWSSPLGTYQQQEAIVASTVEMLERCGELYHVDRCPAEGEASLLALLTELDATPLIASDGTALTGSMLRGYLTSALYQLQAGRTDALDVAGRAVAGEVSAIDALTAAMRDGGSRVGLSGMIVRCLSSPRDPDVLGVYRYIEGHGLPVPLGGPEITDDSVKPWLDLACDALPDSGEDHLRFSNASEHPVLVFGVTGDHATPFAGAQQLVDELGHATLVTVESSGHIATFNGRSSCADDIAIAYLLRGEMPAAGAVCASG